MNIDGNSYMYIYCRNRKTTFCSNYARIFISFHTANLGVQILLKVDLEIYWAWIERFWAIGIVYNWQMHQIYDAQKCYFFLSMRWYKSSGYIHLWDWHAASDAGFKFQEHSFFVTITNGIGLRMKLLLYVHSKWSYCFEYILRPIYCLKHLAYISSPCALPPWLGWVGICEGSTVTIVRASDMVQISGQAHDYAQFIWSHTFHSILAL